MTKHLHIGNQTGCIPNCPACKEETSLRKFKVTFKHTFPETWEPALPPVTEFVVLGESVEEVTIRVKQIYNDEYLDGFIVEEVEPVVA